MKEEDKIIARYGKRNPWKVPEGYFESVRIEIASVLPEYPSKPTAVKLKGWQRYKPYVYLAAMFAGIWCMMQVFKHASDGLGAVSLDNPPQHIASLMKNPDVSDIELSETYTLGESFNDDELIDDVSKRYASIKDFEADFGYQLDPEYNNIDL